MKFKLFWYLKLKSTRTKVKQQSKTRNAMRCNNRDDLLHISFNLKISMFSEAYV